MEALFAVKTYIEENLCRELELMMVQVPLIVDEASGVNDYLDRDGSRTPVEFHISNDRDLQSDRRTGRAGRHEVEAHRARPVRHATR